MTDIIDDDWTEAVDANIPRVDLVGKAANGSGGFLLMKQDAAGLIDPAYVRELIAKAEPERPGADSVTMTGSPAAIAKMIHQAAQNSLSKQAGGGFTYEQFVKAKYDADDLRRMAANGEAMKDESYPIADREDLDRAVRAIGRGGSDHDAIRRHVIARAKKLGASGAIPDNWAADGSLKEGSVTKMEMDDGIDGLDPTVVLAEPCDDVPGDLAEPGSPAWESVDAMTACKWTSILARAKVALGVMADREMMEAASADPDDAMNAMDLQDAACAIDYAISVLAPFAVAEQSESDVGADMMAAVGKALNGFDTAPLDTIEALAQVRKAGRVLSTANEQAIRGAVESLQKVLASLPAAPTTEEAGEPVTKTANEEGDMPQPTPSSDATTDSGQAPAMGTQSAEPQPVAGQAVTDMAKADGDKPEMVAVYDKKGNLVGIVAPDKITMISGAEADDEPAADTDTGATPAADAAPDASDLTPAPAAEVGTPADAVPDDVTKQTDTTEDVLKSIAKDEATAALADYSATQEQVIAKQADALAQLADVVEVLKGQVEALGEQPAMPKVFTNGAVPPRDQLRGQDRGAAPTDLAKAAERKRGLYSSRDATEQNEIAKSMQADAITALQALRQRHVPQ